MKIIIIEDNELLGSNLSMYLKLKNIDNILFGSVEEAKIFFLDSPKIDLILLDINLPGTSGNDYLKELRQSWNEIPVIMLTSKNTYEDIINGLNLWADDYISKPFNYEELVARINSILRRQEKNLTNIFKIDDIEINLDRKKVLKDWKNIYLSALEYNLLEFLIKNKWTSIDRAKIYEKVWWEFDKYMFSRNVDVYVWYLRKKLWKDIIKTKNWEWYYID